MEGEANFLEFEYDPLAGGGGLRVPEGDYEANITSFGNFTPGKDGKFHKNFLVSFALDGTEDSEQKRAELTKNFTAGVRYKDKKTQQEVAGDFDLKNLIAGLNLTEKLKLRAGGKTYAEARAAITDQIVEYVKKQVIPATNGVKFKVKVITEVDPVYGPRSVIDTIRPGAAVQAARQESWAAQAGVAEKKVNGANGESKKGLF